MSSTYITGVDYRNNPALRDLVIQGEDNSRVPLDASMRVRNNSRGPAAPATFLDWLNEFSKQPLLDPGIAKDKLGGVASAIRDFAQGNRSGIAAPPPKVDTQNWNPTTSWEAEPQKFESIPAPNIPDLQYASGKAPIVPVESNGEARFIMPSNGGVQSLTVDGKSLAEIQNGGLDLGIFGTSRPTSKGTFSTFGRDTSGLTPVMPMADYNANKGEAYNRAEAMRQQDALARYNADMNERIRASEEKRTAAGDEARNRLMAAQADQMMAAVRESEDWQRAHPGVPKSAAPDLVRQAARQIAERNFDSEYNEVQAKKQILATLENYVVNPTGPPPKLFGPYAAEISKQVQSMMDSGSDPKDIRRFFLSEQANLDSRLSHADTRYAGALGNFRKTDTDSTN